MTHRASTHYALAALSGLLLYLGWPPLNTVWLLFVAWIPLLWVIDSRIKQQKSYYTFVYTTLLIWNTASTWWIWYSSPAGAVAAVLLNAMLQSIPIAGYIWIRKRYAKPSYLSYAALIIFWMGFEYVHLHWQLAWPWLTLGNGLATLPQLVQWYNITGRLGGTLWLWIINIYIYEIYRLSLIGQLRRAPLKYLILVLLIALPCAYSLATLSPLIDWHKGADISAVAVQPNADPYSVKFDPKTLDQQITNLINLSEKEIDSSTQLVFWPETSLPQPVLLNNVNDDEGIIKVHGFLKKHPHITLITGVEAYRLYDTKATETSKTLPQFPGKYVDSYNAALMLDTSPGFQYYYKSKFVPGVESVPYYSFFKFLEPVLVSFGGMSGNYGSQETATVLTTHDKYFYPGFNGIKVGSVICYESVFGDYCRDYVKNGAHILGIITNDGWWQNTDGHKQHALYASLLAIEMHRCIVRSANTGTSCFIDAQGRITQPTGWWVPTSIKGTVRPYTDKTLYVQWGDILGKISLYLSALIVIGVTLYNRFYDRH